MNNGTKILIVDDDATHRFMLESVLGAIPRMKLMTAYCNGEAVAEALMNGAVAVLNKPLRLGELKTVINQAMGQRCFGE